MKNRAKCKLCQSIIESFHPTDLVLCKCEEISVDGGAAMRCAAKDWANFLRVDDDGKEVPVKVQEVLDVKPLYTKPTKEEILAMVEEQIKNLDNLPPHAMTAPITHYDLYSTLLLLASILRAD